MSDSDEIPAADEQVYVRSLGLSDIIKKSPKL